MWSKEKKQALEKDLESYIDTYGLQDFLLLLECITAEKADHVRTNWRDEKLARQWDSVSIKLAKIAHSKLLHSFTFGG